MEIVPISGASERYTAWCLVVVVAIATTRLFRRLRPKQGALVGMGTLVVIDIIHYLWPDFRHPQTRVDGLVAVAVALLFYPMILGIFWPLLRVADHMCRQDGRSAYIRDAMLNDLFWFALAVCFAYFCLEFAWSFPAR